MEAERDPLQDIEAALRHFTRTPSTLLDSNHRVAAHKAIAALRVQPASPPSVSVDEAVIGGGANDYVCVGVVDANGDIYPRPPEPGTQIFTRIAKP